MEEQVSATLGLPLVEVPARACAGPGAAVRFLVRWLAHNGHVPGQAAARLARSILADECRRPTAIGSGVAVPCGRDPGLADEVGVIGRCATPVEWPGADEPVRVVCVTAGAADRPCDYLARLEQVVRAFRDAPAADTA